MPKDTLFRFGLVIAIMKKLTKSDAILRAFQEPWVKPDLIFTSNIVYPRPIYTFNFSCDFRSDFPLLIDVN